MVRTSTIAGVPTQGLGGPYAISMRGNGLPDRQNVFCSIDVTIVNIPTGLANPGPDRERYGRSDVTANRAHLGRGKKLIDHDHFFSISLGLLFKHLNSHADAGITQTASNGVVFDHSAQVQSLDHDNVKISHKPFGQLIENVLASSADLGVTASHQLSSPCMALRTSLLSCKPTLKASKSFCIPVGMLSVVDDFARRQRCQARYAEVNSNAGASFWQFIRFNSDNKTDKIFARCLSDDRQARRHRWKAPVPAKSQQAKLSHLKTATIRQLKARLRVASCLSTIFLLERRVASPFVEKIRECCLKITERLLKRNAMNLVQPQCTSLPLQDRQRCIRFRIVDTVTRLICFRTNIQRPIVNISDTSKCSSKNFFLIGRRITAICPSSFHDRYIGYPMPNTNGFIYFFTYKIRTFSSQTFILSAQTLAAVRG
jgi:hypothetical protein